MSSRGDNLIADTQVFCLNVPVQLKVVVNTLINGLLKYGSTTLHNTKFVMSHMTQNSR